MSVVTLSLQNNLTVQTILWSKQCFEEFFLYATSPFQHDIATKPAKRSPITDTQLNLSLQMVSTLYRSFPVQYLFTDTRNINVLFFFHLTRKSFQYTESSVDLSMSLLQQVSLTISWPSWPPLKGTTSQRYSTTAGALPSSSLSLQPPPTCKKLSLKLLKGIIEHFYCSLISIALLKMFCLALFIFPPLSTIIWDGTSEHFDFHLNWC